MSKLSTIVPSDVAELDPLNTKKKVAEWAGCTTRHVDAMVASGKFPKPIRLGMYPRWRRSALLHWLNQG